MTAPYPPPIDDDTGLLANTEGTLAMAENQPLGVPEPPPPEEP